MVSFEVHRTRQIAILLMLVAWPLNARSQSASTTEEQRRIVSERIEQARAQGGPYSKELIDPLTSLADIYRDGGNHDLAAAVTEQALQAIRANYGLRSLDQAPLIRERIQSEESRGNDAEAWHLEQALLTLARANPDDLRAAQIFAEIGGKRMDLLRRYNAGEFPPQLQLGCYYDAPKYEPLTPVTGTCTSGSRRVAALAMLADAQRNYEAAIRVLGLAGQYASAELRGLELDLLWGTYTYEGFYPVGRRSLRRLVAYDVAIAKPLAERADGLLQIADWDLLHGRRRLALENYEGTYELLKREGVEPASIAALFSPEIPVILPAFQPNPLATSISDEYIDVSFNITYGTSGQVEILTKTMNVSDEAEKQLVRLIERRLFRPRVVDGEFPRSTPVVLRYYLND
jgi:hypothetical protein